MSPNYFKLIGLIWSSQTRHPQRVWELQFLDLKFEQNLNLTEH